MTASALEQHLNAIESKVEELLAGIPDGGQDQDRTLSNPDTQGQDPGEKENKGDDISSTQSR
jgi:hypothetical protein